MAQVASPKIKRALVSVSNKKGYKIDGWKMQSINKKY